MLALLAIVSVATVLVLYPNEVRRAYRKTQRFAEKQSMEFRVCLCVVVRVSHLTTQIKTNMLHLYESVVEKACMTLVLFIRRFIPLQSRSIDKYSSKRRRS